MNRKFKYLKRILGLLIIIILLLASNVLAAYGDFDDETADNLTEQGIASQPVVTVDKSSNNYLKSLEVEGFVFTPSFDKQTVNYAVEGEVEADKVIIKAEAEDEKATITGIGEVLLQSGENNLRIDVAAESGTVRTYFVKINKKVSNSNLRLSSLTLKSVDNESILTLSPMFSPEVYTYSAETNSYTTSVDVQFTAAEGLKVEVSGNKELKVGTNDIIIKVKGDGDETTIYKIVVNKKAAENTNNEIDNKKILDKIVKSPIAPIVIVGIIFLIVLFTLKEILLIILEKIVIIIYILKNQ